MCDNTPMCWAPVPGYEGIYEANRELLAVRSLDRVIVDRRGQFRCLKGKMLAGGNYRPLRVMLSNNGIGQTYEVSEVIAMTFGEAQVPA